MKHLLHIAIKAALEAGKVILDIYHSGEFDVEIKGDNSPLTRADIASHNVIMSYLEATGIPVLSEEGRDIPYQERKDWKQFWIIDPIDGTKEFIKRNGEFTVNIALVIKGNPVLGIIYVPVSKTLYFTGEDFITSYKIVFRSDYIVSIDEIISNSEKISPAIKDNYLVKIVGSRSHLNYETKKFIKRIENESEVVIVTKGSSLKFCLIAEGEANIYPRYAPTMEWDTAAGQAICQAVGVKVIDNVTRKPLKYNKKNLLNPYFLVTS